MAGKKSGMRLHAPVHIACILAILLMSAACSQLNRELQSNSHLGKARNRMDQEDFDAALNENEKAMAQPAFISKDRALFQRALIYAHPKNPKQDRRRASELFQEVLSQYPGSDLSPYAQLAILLLRQVSNREDRNRVLSEDMDRIRQQLEKQQDIANGYRAELKRQKAQIGDLNRQIEDLKHQIEKLKAIDLNIEKIKQK
jgi:hypothetical protein